MMQEDLMKILTDIEGAEAKLKASQNLGCLDLLFGGFFLSYFKRQRMKEAELILQELGEKIRYLAEKYPDLDLFPPQLDGRRGQGWDIFFDNVFSDAVTQNRIDQALADLRILKNQVTALLK